MDMLKTAQANRVDAPETLWYTPVHLGPLAQLAEQLTLNQPVRGSTPLRLIKHPESRRFLQIGPAILPSGEVSELADEHDLGSCAARRRSSSLLFPTTRIRYSPG